LARDYARSDCRIALTFRSAWVTRAQIARSGRRRAHGSADLCVRIGGHEWRSGPTFCAGV